MFPRWKVGGLDVCTASVGVVCGQQMMQAKSYADYGPHKAAHDDFVGKLGGLKCPLDDATIHFAKDWYVVHEILRCSDQLTVHFVFHSLTSLAGDVKGRASCP